MARSRGSLQCHRLKKLDTIYTERVLEEMDGRERYTACPTSGIREIVDQRFIGLEGLGDKITQAFGERI
jgi:hypothetical protein